MGLQRHLDLPISRAVSETEWTYSGTVGHPERRCGTEDGTELAECGKWVPGLTVNPPRRGPESGLGAESVSRGSKHCSKDMCYKVSQKVTDSMQLAKTNTKTTNHH